MKIWILILALIFWIIIFSGKEIFESIGLDEISYDPTGRLKVFVYELPSKYNEEFIQRDPRCLTSKFAVEIHVHRFLLTSPVRTLNPEEADWFFTPVYTTSTLNDKALPLLFESPRILRSAIKLISSKWPYWNRTEGADHFFVFPHDFGACFNHMEEQAIKRGIPPLLQRATLVQIFGEKNHVCFKDGSIVIPAYVPPQNLQSHLIPPRTRRSIFVHFSGTIYWEGGFYSRGIRASISEKFKNNSLFHISDQHSTTFYEEMQRATFCLCPRGWSPWSSRLIEQVAFGCIPVVIADGIVLPFDDEVPWEEISVSVAEEDALKLEAILTSVPVDEIRRKQRSLADPSIGRAVLYPEPSEPGDAFHHILNRLARKLPHDKSIFLRPGEKILNWTAAGPVEDLEPLDIDD
ncbi:hypothetical protein M569_13073 [Genlisea aurea]|uniref:Exostosin GT47 domain-containing protein n=1 Tax=Genlisea aurea TaxID=192259 RepID=S8C4A5_9LAMI|nr:hypothetical protein M569_13073 [Genlisea aurea]